MEALRKRDVIIIGPFPPPVFGLSSTNAAMSEKLRLLGARVTLINTARSTLSLSLFSRISRLNRIVKGLWKLAWMRTSANCAIYMSISGGLGKIYEIAFILLARIKRANIYLRHASFAYLDSPSTIARLLVYSAGDTTTHITQCKQMSRQLQKQYRASKVISISNAVLYPEYINNRLHHRGTVRVLGFISNISAEKGVFEYLDLLQKLERKKLPIRGKLAGPFQDVETENAVYERLKNLQSVEYVGPKYGDEKNIFFDSIDVFIFPTKYKNETEAKVNHEAMSLGIPVIAYGRGCIPEIVDSDCGSVIALDKPFVPAAFKQIEIWLDNPKTFQLASKTAAQRFSETYEKNQKRWQALLDELTGKTIK